MTEQFGWGVVETRSNAEFKAERSIQALGFEPLLVRYNKLVRGSRFIGDRRVRSRADTVQARPFIPGYLFLPIRDDDDATLVDIADGVKRLFRQRDTDGYLGRPKLIRARLIEQIKEAAIARDESLTPQREDLRQALAEGKKTGQHVKVRLPNGLVATLVNLDDQGRALYFAEIMGAERRGTIKDASALEIVDA